MTKVAFICVHNSCRSQIAEAFGKALAADVFESYSAGTETKPQINPDAVRLMKELYGIDMEKTQYSKLISAIPEPDIAISMGCNVGCPFIGRPFDENWGLDDPTGKSDIERRLPQPGFLVCHLPDIRQQPGAVVRQGHAPVDTGEQLHLQFFFQCCHHLADAGLRIVQRFRRFRETARLAHFQENLVPVFLLTHGFLPLQKFIGSSKIIRFTDTVPAIHRNFGIKSS